MKNKVLKFICAALLVSAPLYANNLETLNDYSNIERNYLEGLSSSNNGLKLSSAYYLGELKSEKAVIPLMEMLRNSSNSSARIMAALSLIKIGNPRGIHMVKREAEFSEDSRVRDLCNRFIKAYYFGSK
jgi:HEAT repeat protein